MQGQKTTRNFSTGAIAGISITLLTLGSASAWWTWNILKSTAPSPTATPTLSQNLTPTQSQAPATAADSSLQVYWVKDTGNAVEFIPAPVTVKFESRTSQDQLAAAFNQLLTGNRPTDTASEIPQGTKLRSLKINAEGIYIDLSREFTTGGGSSSMNSRLGQVLYTATSLQSDARVFLLVEGEPLEVLGGEGLEVIQPLTRQAFVDNYAP